MVQVRVVQPRTHIHNPTPHTTFLCETRVLIVSPAALSLLRDQAKKLADKRRALQGFHTDLCHELAKGCVVGVT